MATQYIYPLSKRCLKRKIGSKASNLRFLMRHNANVPKSWVILWIAEEDYQKNEIYSLNKIQKEFQKIIDPQKFYAVRSSASVEDAEDYSCAGLFKSYLDIQGIDNILNHIIFVWNSLKSPEFDAYVKNVMTVETKPRMAVIIQEMVQAKYSGIVFTKNPVTGLSEIIIEAGKGTGEFQAENHLNPERWVSKWGKWSQKHNNGILNESLANTIIDQSTILHHKFGKPIDLEWVWDGNKLSFIQIRPITRIDIPIYSNRISHEVLPGIIKPLVWSINTNLINPSWARLLNSMTGANISDPSIFTKQFYHRAYFNMSVFAKAFERFGIPGEMLEILQGLENNAPEKPRIRFNLNLVIQLPRILSFSFSFVGTLQRFNQLVKKKKEFYAAISTKMDQKLNVVELMKIASLIFNETQEVAYYNIIIPLLAIIHHRILAILLKNNGYDIRSVELEGSREVAQQYNPQHKLQILHERYFTDSINNIENNENLPPEQEIRLKQDIDQFLQAFGHYSDSGNDFSSVPWRENPNLIRRMIAQSKGVHIKEETIHFKDLKFSWFYRFLMVHLYRRTSRYVASREQISSLYTYGYGQFRTCFIKLGEQLVESSMIDNREDIFYLLWIELKEIVDSNLTTPQQSLISARRQDIEKYRYVVLPELIIGNDQPPVRTDLNSELRGIPTSLGSYSGPARVIQGLDEFEKIKEGDVLIIPFSDVGWTPLFEKAGAVVSESGGILSHSSIIAREYRIPAVVSVLGACRIKDNTVITVNGYTGEIFVH